MITQPSIEVPKLYLVLLNNLYDLEQKLKRHGDVGNSLRNVSKMKDALETLLEQKGGFFYEDPMEQPYNETRTDLEATISGKGTEELTVVEVIKPIIRFGERQYSRVVQKGIVVVQSKQQS